MKGTNRKKMSGRLTFFLFTLIPVILYTFFYVVSVINGVRYSFTDWDGMAQKFNFIGLKNYQTLLKILISGIHLRQRFSTALCW